jgi:hypothetical protein
MGRARKLLEKAAAAREEASSRRSLARLLLVGELQRQFEQLAHDLEVEAAALEEEARLEKARKRWRAWTLSASGRS